MGYSIDGADFKDLLVRDFASAPSLPLRGGVIGSPSLIRFTTRRSGTQDLAAVHFSADFPRDVRVQGLQDVSHVSLHFQLSGNSDASIRGIKGNQSLSAGQYNLYHCVNPKADFHFPKQDGYSYLAFIIGKGYLEGLADSIGGEGLGRIAEGIDRGEPFAHFTSPVAMDRSIRQVLTDVVHMRLPEDLCGLYLQGKFVEVLSLALAAGGYPHLAEQSLKGGDLERLDWVHSYIRKNFLESLSLGDLSRLSGLNEFKLKKGFRERYNMTVFGYITDLRLNHARCLLRSNLQVSHVAFEVGYSSSGSFIQAFKGKFGVTPSFFL